jgi:hypothetical protein
VPKKEEKKMKALTKTFHLTTQHYGDFFSGYPWSIYGCLTFKNSVSSQHGEALVKNFMRRLRQKIKSPVPYIAVAEHKYSGLDASIQLHYHFLACCPPQWANQFQVLAAQIWSQIGGNCDIHPYDSSQDGAYYIAKTASHNDFHWIQGDLNHLTYTGQHDLYSAAQESSYVPKHAKGHLAPLTTLVVQQPPSQTPGTKPLVQSIAAKKAVVTTPTTKLHPSSKPAHEKQIALPGPKIPLVAHVWRKHLAKSLNQSVGPLTPQQYGQLKLLRNKVGETVLPLIEYAIYNWEIFANNASSQAGYSVPPSVPNISFLLKHYRIALQLAYDTAKQKKLKNSSDHELIQLFATLQESWSDGTKL